MEIYKICLYVAIVTVASLVNSSVSAPQRGSSGSSGDYSVTHLDIRDAILSLVSVLRDQMDKLERHEVRERQLGEQLTRSLSSIEKRTRGEEKNIENIASFIGRIDERVKGVQGVVDKQTEDGRIDSQRIRQEFELLRNVLQGVTGDGSVLGGLDSKVNSINDKVNMLKDTGDRTVEKFDSLMELWKNSGTSSSTGSFGVTTTDAIMSELADIKDTISRTQELETQILTLKSGGGGGGSSGEDPNAWRTEIIEGLDSQSKQLAMLEEEIGRVVSGVSVVGGQASDITKILGGFRNDTVESLSGLVHTIVEQSGGLKGVVEYSTGSLESRVSNIHERVGLLSDLVTQEFTKVSSELKGLANVESVLLDTGDSVLDTKRRVEYGVQQIVGELGSQLGGVSKSLNESLQRRFDGLAESVVGNQSWALMNLTGRMEEEISQVWRQIGILYHSMSKSSELLDEIHSQTSSYVNISLDSISSMDGKVGLISNRMGEVDDNLNYLLGRMSLVVQEFNQIKSGLGEALSSLRDSFSEVQEFEAGVKSGGNSSGGGQTQGSSHDNNEVDGGGGDGERNV